MRIGIEGLPLLFHRTGTSTYTHELVQHLRRLGKGDKVILFARNQRMAGGSYHDISYTERAANYFYKEYRLPEELANRKIDVYHSPRDMGLPSPAKLPCASVMTLHDIILVRAASDYYGPAQSRFYERRLLKRVREVDHVITVSNFSKEDIVNWSGINEKKVSVVYNGVAEKFRPVTGNEELQLARSRYRLPHRFVLAVGSTEPRKNVRTAIEAFNRLRQVQSDIHLVVTGVDYCRVKPEKAFAGLDLEGVVFTGYVCDFDMPALNSLAEALLFPSLYEGFGLPPLEAMACGTPVVTSNTTSIPEVVGDAAVLINPKSASDIAGALEMVLDSQSTREELIQKGRERAASFTWKRTAAETRKIYDKLV
jgi:glycosyltransferase involved in cell wall biosynthesis